MARAKLARAWPALFWCCFYQHQSSARPAPGADQRVSERSSARPGPKFLARSKVTRFPGVSRAGWSQWTVSEHFRSVYGVSSYHDSYPARGRVREWSLKSSAALLIVCERNFILLGADYFSADLVRTKDDELLKGVSLSKERQNELLKRKRDESILLPAHFIWDPISWRAFGSVYCSWCL